jgi:hypothetical protein
LRLARLAALSLAALTALAACHPKDGNRAAEGGTREGGLEDAASVAALDPVSLDLWTRAAEGERDDLARLCDHEGSDRLIEVAADRSRRVTALRALEFADDLTPLPFLADVASTGTDDEAREALLSASALVASPHRAVDPEDALEIAEGTRRLLALARDKAAPTSRRVLAIRALRLLADRGAVSAKDVPTDLDAR